MIPPYAAKECRLNPERAVYVSGEINEALLHRVTPEILRLRAKSSDPITVYLDSPGGDVYVADRIMELISSPDQDGNKCAVITCATNTAASAAAFMLASGGFAVAYPRAYILLHGIRNPVLYDVTTELASMAANRLQAGNQQRSLQLADWCLGRFLIMVSWLSGKDAPESTREFIENFVDKLCHALKGKPAKQLVRDAHETHKGTYEMLDYISDHRSKEDEDRPLHDIDFDYLRCIIDYLRTKDSNWRLKGNGIQELKDRFDLFYDFFLGAQRDYGEIHLHEYGSQFLTEEQFGRYLSLKTEDEKNKFLENQVGYRFQAIWYLLVVICRKLCSDDNPLNPEDAYWLGIVDEVIGSGLPSRRDFLEEKNKRDMTEAEANDSDGRPDAPDAG